ncbi:hypothetical protein [Stakelama marina]|uniref:Uncharacterized protein n=1 Tax=Stakelama marina TaxID=2826939 RepID=A0A8T4IFR1_9SPHN|nr:hypothetical protein [Stakelama marina]MBR0553390.1 hypothetical protein [Stakelama marina]
MLLGGCQEMHELGAITRSSARPTTDCIARVFKGQGGQSVETGQRYVGKRYARIYGVDAKALGDVVEMWLPDGGPQVQAFVFPNSDGGAVVDLGVVWMGPGYPPQQVGAIADAMTALEKGLADHCAVDFTSARRERKGDDVKAYFAGRD